MHLIVNELSVLSLLAGRRGWFFLRYCYIVKIDFVLAKIAVTY